jgi:outer membrane protein assembly factor BamB
MCLLVLAACGRSAGEVATPTATPRLPASLYVVGGDGGSDGNDALSALSATDGRKRWSTPLSGGLRGQPVIAGGVVYVGGELGEIKMSPGGVTALRARDGKQLWQDALGPWFATTPLPGVGAVYTSTTAGVYALRSSDGHILWQLQPSAPSHGWSIAPQLALAQGRLYVAIGGFETSATLYALRPGDGAILWRYSPPNSVGDNGLNLVVRSPNVYLSTSTTLYALRAADGTLAWSTAAPPWYMAVTDDAVYTVSGWEGYCTPAGVPLPQVSTVTARRASDGVVLWSAHLNGRSGLRVVATASAVYLDMQTGTLMCPLQPGQDPFTPTAETLFALASASGNVLWHDAVQSPVAFAAWQPTDTTVYIASWPQYAYPSTTMGTLYALAASSGVQVWRHDLDNPSSFVVAAGTIYISGLTISPSGSAVDGRWSLYAMRTSDGTTLWTVPETAINGLIPPTVG